MKRVMRPRYYCDFCNKGGGSGGHIRRHEDSCTKNPQRKCRMCASLFKQPQADLGALMALLPTAEQQCETNYADNGASFTSWKDIDAKTVEALREAANQCPACMMAALRQRGLPVPTATTFNFTEECKSAWALFQRRAMGARVCRPSIPVKGSTP